MKQAVSVFISSAGKLIKAFEERCHGTQGENPIAGKHEML